MATTYTYTRHDGTVVRVVVPNASERISGTRGNWSVRCVTRDRSADQHGITTKRAARKLALQFAEIERNVCRDMGAKRAQPVRHFVADGIKFATCGAASPKLQTADWARVTCPACTTDRDRRAQAAAAATPKIHDLAVKIAADRAADDEADAFQRAACQREADAYAAAVADDFGATIPASDDDHRPTVRPTTSRFVGDDARNGLEASCWECGGRIIARPYNATYRHLGDAVEDAHGEALVMNARTPDAYAARQQRMAAAVARLDALPVRERGDLLTRCRRESITLPDLFDMIDDAHGEAIAEDRARTATAGRTPDVTLVVRGDQLPDGATFVCNTCLTTSTIPGPHRATVAARRQEGAADCGGTFIADHAAARLTAARLTAARRR